MMLLKQLKYSNISSASQKAVWNFIRYNSTVNTYSTNVIDKNPTTLNEDFGFPLIVVENSHREEPELTMSMRQRIITFNITILSKSSDVIRKLIDAVSYSIYSNEAFFSKLGMSRLRFTDGRADTRETESGSSLYEFRFVLQFEWVGSHA
jgi:hypothetical protein